MVLVCILVTSSFLILKYSLIILKLFAMLLEVPSRLSMGMKPFQWTSNYVLNVYCPFAAATPRFATTCQESHFSPMSEYVRAKLKRQ